MVKKILKYILIIFIIIVLLMLALAFRPDKKKNEGNKLESITVDDQIEEVLSIDENDKNIIGYISISELGIENAPIADGTDNKTIEKYVGHFKNSSYLNGNVCLCSHNRGNKATFFQNLKDAKKEMKIEYRTKYETKTYLIKEIKEIDETDLSILNSTKEDRITLITCIANKKSKRLCVIGLGE